MSCTVLIGLHESQSNPKNPKGIQDFRIPEFVPVSAFTVAVFGELEFGLDSVFHNLDLGA